MVPLAGSVKSAKIKDLSSELSREASIEAINEISGDVPPSSLGTTTLIEAELGKLHDSPRDQQDSCKTEPFGRQSDQSVTGPEQNIPMVSDELAAQTLGSAGRAMYEAINASSDVHHLDEAARLLWTSYGSGAINDDEATYLSGVIDRRRPLRRRTAPGLATQVARINGRFVSRFASRPRQRSPDRKASRDRRRMLGGSGGMPNSLRHHYTEGQRAVLCIVAFEIKRHGICDFPIEKIAALAGVGRTTVQTTMHEARRLGHITIIERPRPGKKNLTNLVRISSLAWLAWIMRGPSASLFIGSNPVKKVSTTKIKDLRKKEACNESNVSDPMPWIGLRAVEGRPR